MEQSKNRWTIIRLNETKSTNSYLKELMAQKSVDDGTVVSAEFQSAGRGQRGNTWFSGKSKNLLFSFLVYPRDVLAVNQFVISRMVSLAVKRTLDQFTDDIRIKWPNDIYWKDRKIAGILIENTLEEKNIAFTIIGIGLNVNEDDFPTELPNPVSLKQITNIDFDFDRERILNDILHEYYFLQNEFQQNGSLQIEKEYMSDLYRGNGYYPFRDANGEFQAKIDDVLSSGHLVLKPLNEIEKRTYTFKEVQFITTEVVNVENEREFLSEPELTNKHNNPN